MLLGSFFNIASSSKDAHTAHATLTINAEHQIFKGHFPELPVVPGVCQTQMLCEAVNEILGSNYEVAEASSIKFLALLNPKETSQVQLELKFDRPTDDSISVKASYTWGDTTYFKFRGTLKAIAS